MGLRCQDRGCPLETQARIPVTTIARVLRHSALALLGLASGLAGAPAPAAAEPRPMDARVVWAHADRVYIAATDSIGLAPGDLLTLRLKKKDVASAEVVQVLARDLAAARLTHGSLARASRLDRLRILAERPPLRARAVLRVGCPGRGRQTLLFECDRPRPRPPLAGNAYRTDSLGENAYRLVRGTAGVAPPWPDTILVRLFGEAADQEIALERGELDVAVFWPGEASSRLRADPRWQGLLFGSRSRGALAATTPAGAAAAGTGITPGHPALAALNEELFRGDLAPWIGEPGSGSSSDSPSAPAAAARDVRFEVDSSCPGRPALERFLDRVSPAAGPPASLPVVRLVCLDVPAPASGPHREALLFRARCAIACEPGSRAYVLALDPDAFADLLDCGPAGRAP
jgi:hypothetical protein